MIEPSPRQAAGNLHRKDECLFSVRSLTPPQAARHALAIAVQIAQETVHDESTIDQVMDASKLDFPNESFNAIFDFGIIHHIPNWKNGIEELKRVLKDGGELIQEELSLDTFSGFPGRLYRSLLSHPYEQMFSTEEFVQHIENVGFGINGFKKANPFKMMQHFSLVACVQ
jgi:ubiquinone/menaquinone biosynthesis C-methylase UbiE